MNLNPSFKVRVLFKDEHLKSEDCRVKCSKRSQPVHLTAVNITYLSRHNFRVTSVQTNHTTRCISLAYTRHQNNAES